jgi:hypothetical protein
MSGAPFKGRQGVRILRTASPVLFCAGDGGEDEPMSQCKRLWEVRYRLAGIENETILLICAPTAAMAATKARTFLRKQGDQKIEVWKVESGGVIDVL